MSDRLTARELQTLRNMGNEAGAAADEIDALRAEVERLRSALQELALGNAGDVYQTMIFAHNALEQEPTP